MTDFWAIIDDTVARSGGDEDGQLELLRQALKQLGEEELRRFIGYYAAAHTRAYDWNLWGAAFLINGGASDDGFAYFRDWLISRGREVYEAALTDPDNLAGHCTPDEAEFEDFRYVAIEEYTERTGGEPDYSFDPTGEPAGAEFSEADLEERFPKLASWLREQTDAVESGGRPDADR